MAVIPVNQRKLMYFIDMLENYHLHLLPLPHKQIYAEMRAIVKDINRRKAVRKAPVTSQRMTVSLQQRLRLLALAYPDKTEQEIAAFEGVTAGRVSEAVAGKRR